MNKMCDNCRCRKDGKCKGTEETVWTGCIYKVVDRKEVHKMTIRHQAKSMGHEVVGSLKRCKDDVFYKNGETVHNKIYIDNEGTEYAVNWRGELIYICGEDWVI